MSKNTPQQLQSKQPQHLPVLLEPTIELLAPKAGDSYLDLTAGFGGHGRAIIAQTNAPQKATLVDRDESALASLSDLAKSGVSLIHQDFLSAAQQLVAEGQQFDLILVDLGVSSPQLDNSKRGFSFSHSGPLDMRMDVRQANTAADIVNRSSAQQLAEIITKYGEEKPKVARRYAEAIVKARPLYTTDELAQVIVENHRGSWSKTHPATRTFQAIRIELNDELVQVEGLLQLLPKLLNSGGRLAIISFHSLEDRLVKHFMLSADRAGYESELSLINKKPILGSTDDVHNPRSRSSRLRAAVKNKKKGA